MILRGIVQPAAFGDGGASITQREVRLLSQNIHINFWRLNLNPVWRNTNVIVPKVRMPYQQWIQTLVGWMKANGMYVELDKDPQFTEPPCGGANVFCPHQDAGSLEAAHHALPGDPDPDDPNAWQETSASTVRAPLPYDISTKQIGRVTSITPRTMLSTISTMITYAMTNNIGLGYYEGSKAI